MERVTALKLTLQKPPRQVAPRAVDAVEREYLSWEGDENLPVWLEYDFIAQGYK